MAESKMGCRPKDFTSNVDAKPAGPGRRARVGVVSGLLGKTY